ncbi:TRAP transporter small permease [Vallitalea pronyensis]|uniref:TRAP transporter small permease n=1 Tax=Vallitalea pronyensis TaxID=1348613 RepID=A0A8J8MLB2_9FIRM|nr:TRAP transporter small permease [Vallitalea pronyensis]QUI23619.1 TRAP transporter small permease [Vallitalea pronyensis]
MAAIKSGLNKILSYVISLLLIVMTSLVLVQVFTRYILNNPSDFTEELVIIILVWTSFLGAAYAFGSREHMSLIFLRQKLTGTKKVVLSVFIDGLVLLFALYILILGGKDITQEVIDTRTPLLQISKSYIYVCTLVSGIIISFFQVINIIEDLKMTSEKGEK